MKSLKRTTTGLIGGLTAAGLYLVWSLLVASGLGHRFLNWLLSLCFIINPFQVSSFNPDQMIAVAAAFFILGFGLGWVGGTDD